jgi:4-amino-4-deoxy-L-arabinose transferase-like glycosyltransferase
VAQESPDSNNNQGLSAPPASGPVAARKTLALKLSGLLLVMLTSCMVFFSGLGQYPLFNPDEALYAEPAREMLVTGEYVTTLLNYVVRYTKPPLSIWAMALCYKVFGVNEYAARFFGVACAALLVAAVYLMIARYVSIRAAVVGALSLAVAPLFVLTAREAITDMPLALFMAGSQLAFFHAYKARRFGFALAAYILLGLAVMTKGPVGIVLPLAILFAYHCLRGEVRAALSFYRPVTGALIVGAIVIPWFALEISVTKGAYFQEFIVRENFQRFTAVVDNHKQPFWYHAAAMFAGYFPFSFYLPQFLWPRLDKLIKSFKGGETILAKLSRLRAALLANSNEEDLYFYCILWAFFVLVFFSLSVSKLLPYTLPAFPAMAVLVAGELEGAFVAANWARICYPLMAMLLVYAGAGVLAPHFMQKVRSLPAELPGLVKSFAAVQAGLAFLAILLGRLRFFACAVTMFALLSAGVFAVYQNRALPVLSAKLEGQLPDFAHFAGQSDLPIIVFDMRKPGVPFYALRRVENINGGDELGRRLSQVPAAYILTRVDKLAFLQSFKKARVVSKNGEYALVHFVNEEAVEK